MKSSKVIRKKAAYRLATSLALFAVTGLLWTFSGLGYLYRDCWALSVLFLFGLGFFTLGIMQARRSFELFCRANEEELWENPELRL